MKSILFLLTHFRNGDEVREFVAQIAHAHVTNARVHVAIADNSGDFQAPAGLGASVRVYRSTGNVGYLPGCADAMDRWLAEGAPEPDWIVVANSDLKLDLRFVERLASLELPAEAGVVAPEILLSGGAQQNPLLWKRPLRLSMWWYSALARFSIFSAAFEIWVAARHVLRGWRRPARSIGSPVPIYAPHGSLMIFHRRFFERGGSLRYGACMYGEEIHVAEQARRAGVGVVWCRELVSHHFEHSTTSSLPVGQRTEWRAESAAHLWREYFRDGMAA